MISTVSTAQRCGQQLRVLEELERYASYTTFIVRLATIAIEITEDHAGQRTTRLVTEVTHRHRATAQVNTSGRAALGHPFSRGHGDDGIEPRR